MSHSGIYMIKNRVTGECYVGSSARLQQRKREHFNALRKGRHYAIYLQRSYNQHGEDAFEWVILEDVPADRDLLLERETHWIQQLQPAYNSTNAHASNLGIKYTGQALANITAAQQNPETRRKRSEALKGRKITPEAIEKYKKTRTGMPVHPETKKKLSEALKGRKWSEERQQKHIPRTPTEEARQRLSELAKARWQDKERRLRQSEKIKEIRRQAREAKKEALRIKRAAQMAEMNKRKAEERSQRRREIADERAALAKHLYHDAKHSIVEICAMLGISRSTFFRYVRGTKRASGSQE